MGKAFRAFRQSQLPSLQGAREFAFTYKKQKEQESITEEKVQSFFQFNEFEHGATSSGHKHGIPPKPGMPTTEPVDPPDFFPAESDVDEPEFDEGNPRKRGRGPEKSQQAERWIRKAPRRSFEPDMQKEDNDPPSQCFGRQKVKASQRRPNDVDDMDLPDFVTARQKLAVSQRRLGDHNWGDASRKHIHGAPSQEQSKFSTGMEREVLSQRMDGGSSKAPVLQKRGVRSGFVPPMRSSNPESSKGPRGAEGEAAGGGCSGAGSAMAGTYLGKEHNNEEALRKCLEMLGLDPDGEVPERLRNLEPRIIEHTINEIMTRDTGTTWTDIAGLERAKRCVMEMVIWPLKRPDLFRGTRAPGKGLLLYGPPGTGKTLIGKAIAGESKATFFSISASSLTSKWIGEGEKLVRALFGVASCVQPAVIFIDEIDSLLSQRKGDGEHESSRRLKTQFLIEMEGCSGGNEQVLLIGATNRPQELDPAVRRRMSNRLYIPLPEAVARAEIVKNLLEKDGLLTLSNEDIDTISKETEGYSGSDMKNLVKEASMEPLREAMMSGDIDKISNDEIRPLSIKDFRKAVRFVRPSVAPEELLVYKEWSQQFGSGEI